MLPYNRKGQEGRRRCLLDLLSIFLHQIKISTFWRFSINSALLVLLHECLTIIFFFSSLHVFFIILFILFNVFVLVFCHPYAVAKSWIFSWHEMSVMQLLSLEISKNPLTTVCQGLSNSFTAQLFGQQRLPGHLLCSETAECCKASSCSTVSGHSHFNIVSCISKETTKTPTKKPQNQTPKPCFHLWRSLGTVCTTPLLTCAM